MEISSYLDRDGWPTSAKNRYVNLLSAFCVSPTKYPIVCVKPIVEIDSGSVHTINVRIAGSWRMRIAVRRPSSLTNSLGVSFPTLRVLSR
jgi:hypothetical protein